MCEKYIFAKGNPEKTDFSIIFDPIRKLLMASDYVIGNLETVFAGSYAGYTKSMYSFNTPDIFLEVLASLPIDFVTTSNNHALDRGKEGIIRTIHQLNKQNIRFTGTSETSKSSKFYEIVNVENVKIAFMSLTASVNYFDHNFKLDSSDERMLNLMAPQDYRYRKKSPITLKRILFKIVNKILGQERFMKIRKIYGGTYNLAYDDPLDDERMSEIYRYSNIIKNAMHEAKENSDILVICPHMGGQFNVEPGTFSKWYMDFFKTNGADLVVGNHPHVIQKICISNDCTITYSLGNFSMYPDSTYIIKKDKPQVGLLLNVYISKTDKSIHEISCVPIKMVAQNKGMLVKPLFDELKKHEIEVWKNWLSSRLEQKLILRNEELFIVN